MSVREKPFAAMVLGGLLGTLAGAPAAVAAEPRIAYWTYSNNESTQDRVGAYTVRPDGSGVTRLSHGAFDARPRWSPDRRWIAFVRTRSVISPTTGLSEERATLVVTRPDGSDRTAVSRITGDFDWAPGSRRLVFELESDLWIATRDGSSSEVVMQTATPEGDPDWSPSGASIAYYGTSPTTDPLEPPGVNGDVFVVDLPDRTPRRLTTDGADDFEPRWSPDGSRIAFLSTRGHCCEEEVYGSDLYLVAADGTGEVRLTDDCTWKSSFAWLGGSRLVLEAQPDDDACQPEVMPELRVVDADDGSDRSLLADGRDVSEPEPSPSGRWVAFTSFRRGATDLFRVRVSDRVVRRLTRTRDINEATPDW